MKQYLQSYQGYPHQFFPAHFYTDSDLVSQEKEKIFHQTWLYVGDIKQLFHDNNIFVTEISDISILLIQSEKDFIRAYYNLCPHRASLLCSESGQQSLKQLVCPYHAWVYNLEGKLIGTPAQERFPENFKLEDYPLKAIRCDVWEGFLFVSFNPNAPELKTFLGSIPQTIQGYRLPETKLLVQETYEVACNWKVYHDNTLCDYHVPVVHRNTLNKVQGAVRYYKHYFDTYVNLLYTPTTEQWRKDHPILDTIPLEKARYGFFTYGIFPNLHFLALPDGVLAWIRIDPLTVNSCQVHLEIYGIPDFSLPAEQLSEEFAAFMKEDMAVTEMVQKGYESGGYEGGIANQLEDRILHQQTLIRDFLRN
ncbi:MAG: aromatic ring-hydroxylating dioxygenase subunit alpha [Halothece sp. Uz-M2-17]|nr:aromatic ring-hydroxylating dioxygenase subunit alpha [Halothece sp. Uz-M2-17]